MPLSRPTVLILSINASFARELVAHWPADSQSPEFTVLDNGLCRSLDGSCYDLAIADASSRESASMLKPALAATSKPAILILGDRLHADSASPLSQSDGTIIELHRSGSLSESSSDRQIWASIAGLVGREILCRSFAEARQRDAESACATLKAEATLGRYIVEMRNSVNNALTSILGNAELLALDPGLPANVLEQADTIRNMALRLNEIFQRFSSIEKELSVAARESGKAQAHACAAGR